MSQLIFSKYQNSKEIGPNANKGVDLSVRLRADRQRKQTSFLHVLFMGCQGKVGVAQLKVAIPTSKDMDLRYVFLPQKVRIGSGSSYFI